MMAVTHGEMATNIERKKNQKAAVRSRFLFVPERFCCFCEQASWLVPPHPPPFPPSLLTPLPLFLQPISG